MRNDWLWILLIVIRRQPVILFAHEHFKKPPRPPRDKPRISYLFGSQWFGLDRNRLADPIRNNWRKAPQEEKRCCDKNTFRPQYQNEHCHTNSDRGSRQHETQKRNAASGCHPTVLRRRHPFQQVPMRDEIAINRPHNSVDHQVSLMCAEGDVEQHLRSVNRHITPGAPKMIDPGDAARLDQQSSCEVRIDGKRESEQDE